MKKTILIATLMGASPLLASSFSFGQKELRENQIISLLNLDERAMQDFTQGKMGDYTLECPKGAYLPLRMTLKGEFLALESAIATPLYLRVLKNCYIRCENKEKFLFSSDLEQWEEFPDFFTGELKVSVETQNGGPVARVELELNQRKT